MSVQEMREVFVKDVLQDLDGYTQVVRTANNVGGYCALLGILRQLAEFADLPTAEIAVLKIAGAPATAPATTEGRHIPLLVQEMREAFFEEVRKNPDGYTLVASTAKSVGGYCALLGILRQLAEFADLRTAGSVVRKIAEAAAEGR